KIDLYESTFVPNTGRWPWPTFHRDNARTGCTTAPAQLVSASIVGRVKTPGEVGIRDVRVEAQYWSGSTWITDTTVYGRTTIRTATYTVGNTTSNDEINEGGYTINQLTPERRYRLKVTN